MSHFAANLVRWNAWSIQRKLITTLIACLVAYSLISGGLSVWMTRAAVRDRITQSELPAAVGAIRADIQRQIGAPLNAVLTFAKDPFLLRWESQGLPDSGVEDWKQLALAVKQQQHAAAVDWISASTLRYFSDAGYVRQINDQDGWFKGFLASGQPYALNLDKEVSTSSYMLFINARFDAGDGRVGVASLGLSVDAMAKTIRDYKLGQTGSVFLVNPQGQLLIHRDESLLNGQHNLQQLYGLSDAEAKTLLNGQPFASVGTHAGATRILASAFVPELNAYVIADVPEAELLGPVNRAVQLAALIGSGVGGAIALVLVMAVARALSAPIQRASILLNDIADGQGDLTRRLRVESSDEVGQLSDAFNRFVGSLSSMVQQVRQATDSITTASQEVSSGTAHLSQRTEQAASALEQTSSAMTELSGSVEQNAQSAGAACRLAEQASVAAHRNGEVMQRVIQVMQGIEGSASKINDIIGVIDGIAFQTNILALNAAVEAARAGEQGRGFAVVAGEVRSLAQRSAEAAREVRQLIQASGEQVSSGATLVHDAGQGMNDLRAAVERVHQTMLDITQATREQSRGLLEISRAVSQLDDATQQNAALVEESSAAGESLKEQALLLSAVVGNFRTGQAAD